MADDLVRWWQRQPSEAAPAVLWAWNRWAARRHRNSPAPRMSGLPDRWQSSVRARGRAHSRDHASCLLVERSDHPLILVVLVDAVSKAISSALSTARFRRTDRKSVV